MRSIESYPGSEARSGLSALCAALAIVLLAGCAPLMQNLTGGEGAKKYQAAESAFKQGKYAEARIAFRALAEDRADPRRAEQAAFKAAYILIYHDNPDKDYSRALREFDEFQIRYPSSELAGEARSWLAMLKNFEQSKAKELLQQVVSLNQKTDELTRKLQTAEADDEAVTKERDRLVIEKNELTKKVDALLGDKDGLLKEKAALLKERDGIAREKIVLEKKVDNLTRDKENLILAKEKLEKSLHDLTMVDVKMEKKRKKVK